jgi:cyclopropane-fatty-acyl-phospholipid synthase
MSTLIRIAETGLVPDPLLRIGIRHLLRQRLRNERRRSEENSSRTGPGSGRNGTSAGAMTAPTATEASMAAGIAPSRRVEARALTAKTEAPGGAADHSPVIAVATDKANEQHYELPPDFFQLMLGPRLKYSSCHWSSVDQGLGEAEEEMLRLTSERADIRDGMTILDLGSGWGSLGLWIAEHFPGCRVTTVSNSEPQQQFIRERAAERGLANVEAIRADVNELSPGTTFDRVVSVEMFEHVREHGELLARIRDWLSPGGKLFVHIFCHRETSYLFELDGDNDWMARHFFTGGMMPSLDLLNGCDRHLRVTSRWEVAGTHYQRTLLAWLEQLDGRKEEAMKILATHYGADRARLWFVRWRLFLLACAELFGYREGREWLVGHYLLEPVSP